MKTKYTIPIIIALVLLAGCHFDNRGCLVPLDTEGTNYVFELPVSIYPLKSKLQVGDTLILNVDMDDNISEIMSDGKDKHQLKDFPLYLIPQVERLEDDLIHAHDFYGYYDMKNQVDILPLTGTSKPASENSYPDYNKYYFAYHESRYQLQLAIIPKQKGVYVVSFNSIEYPKGSFPWLCTYQGVTARIKVNQDKSNYELLQKHTEGTHWRIGRENKGKGYSTWYTISHDSLPNYRPPRSLLVDYCFEVN
ncbi:MAG: hypothetical protein WCL06_12395 [Bacteroidota bacterium]